MCTNRVCKGVFCKMTQTFEEYLEQEDLGKVICFVCGNLLCYTHHDAVTLRCVSCMKKDYEENKK